MNETDHLVLTEIRELRKEVREAIDNIRTELHESNKPSNGTLKAMIDNTDDAVADIKTNVNGLMYIKPYLTVVGSLLILILSIILKNSALILSVFK